LVGRARRAHVARFASPATTANVPERNTQALVVGVADDFAPRIENEARAVSGCLAPCDTLIGPEATVARVIALAPAANVLHLACHALFVTNNPQGSGLKLADRWLSLREVYELRLKAELVVLSGCETGRHAVAAGDELVGLLRGFLVAGAAAVVVSLWSVHDECTSALMACLYNEWRSGAKAAGPAGALRAAQLAVRRAYPHPAFWAPFVLIGGL
jgi:CHAT domain-containing protein